MVDIYLDAGEHIAVMLHVIGDLVVAIDTVQVDKDGVPHPVGIEGHVVIDLELAANRSAVGRTGKPAVEAVVVAHGDGQVGGLDRGAGVNRERGDFLAASGVEGDRRGLYPLGIKDRVLGHGAGLEVVSLRARPVNEPAGEAIALARGLELGSGLPLLNLDLGHYRTGRVVLVVSTVIGRKRHQGDE